MLYGSAQSMLVTLIHENTNEVIQLYVGWKVGATTRRWSTHLLGGCLGGCPPAHGRYFVTVIIQYISARCRQCKV
jgi:hypothetical protein